MDPKRKLKTAGRDEWKRKVLPPWVGFQEKGDASLEPNFPNGNRIDGRNRKNHNFVIAGLQMRAMMNS